MKDIKRIEKFIEGIQWLFQINNFNRTLTIEKEDDDGADKRMAEINFDEEYQTIKIKIFPCFWKESLEKQRKALLHELCHSITMPSKVIFYDFLDGTATATKDQAKFLNERATSQIENILDGLLQGRMKYAREAYADFIKVKKRKKKCKTKSKR